MCTYQTETLVLEGSAKGPEGWRPVSTATVYYDHPNSLAALHSLNIDFLNLDVGAAPRVAAVELDAASARELAHAILRTLDMVDNGARRHES